MADIVFRCDASGAIGAGHVMRCLASAEALAWAGWRVAFATLAETVAAVPALTASGHELRGPDELAADWVVFDNYGLTDADERAARGQARNIAAFEDIVGRAHAVDLLVDPTPGRVAGDYASVARGARVLAGVGMAQMRGIWRGARSAALARRDGDVRRILVSMGATDPVNATAKVLAGLRAAKLDVKIDVVLTSAAPHLAEIRAGLQAGETLHVDVADMPALVTRADFAIGAAGSSCFERAILGLPSIIVQTVDNQADLIGAFAAAGAAEAVPFAQLAERQAFGARVRALVEDAPRLQSMSARAAALVDGRGPQRLLAALAGDAPAKVGTVRLRLAEAADTDWLFDLQCQPATRAFALNPEPPSLDDHRAWMAATLDNPNRLLLIAEFDAAPAGMLRFDRAADGFVVSIAVDSARHGQGIGGAMLALARRLVRHRDLIATVLPENSASLALFTAAGYRPAGPNLYRNAA